MNRQTQIEAVVDDVIRRRELGEDVVLRDVEQHHPHLMPELRDRLQVLQAIQAAAVLAHRQKPPPDAPEVAGSAMDENLSYLGDALDGYEILERLHDGGQGVVYKAVQQSTNRVVAIKVLLDGPLATDRQRHRFEREVGIIARLRHPNIVTLYDSGVVRGRQFFAMEFVDGLTIDDYVLLHSLGAREIVRIFQVVCEAVSDAHQHGVIHRDLKPSNILVDSDGQPHILDFGLAKDLSHGDATEAVMSVSIAGQVVGTLPYLSPEQANGQADQVDVRSDIYSLGVVLFQLLTGCFPYSVDGDRHTVLNNIVSQEPARPRRVLRQTRSDDSYDGREINDDLERIVLKALEKDKIRRYQSASALAADLGRYLIGDAVEAKAASALYVLKKTVRKFRVHVAVTAAFMVLVSASAIGLGVLWQRAETQARVYQAGLNMGSYLKLGSVARDEGRVDQAVAMFEKAVELGARTPTTERAVSRFNYGANHQLAELYFLTGRGEEAEPYCLAAIKIAKDLSRENPEDLEWRGQLSFAYALQGQMAMSRESWESALEAFGEAAAIRKEFASRDPDHVGAKSDLAYALDAQGSCCRRLRRFEESLEYYSTAYEIRRELQELEPERIGRVIDLADVEGHLAVWHLSQNTADHDELARTWLERTRERISEVDKTPDGVQRAWDIQRIMSATEANLGLIRQRAERRADRAD